MIALERVCPDRRFFSPERTDSEEEGVRASNFVKGQMFMFKVSVTVLLLVTSVKDQMFRARLLLISHDRIKDGSLER